MADLGQANGAANRIRTCDPVITNDVLYQLSYCGGPCNAFRQGRNACDPDIGHRAALQELEDSARSESRGFGRKSRRIGLNPRSPAPARQKPAPAAGLGLRRIG
jgi:hypothetical protein